MIFTDLDILIDTVADKSIVKSTPQDFWTNEATLYLNPSQDYIGNSIGDYLFTQVYINDKPRFLYWKGPWRNNCACGYWDDTPQSLGIGASGRGISPDFPQAGQHLIFEMRINLDWEYNLFKFGDSFGFTAQSWNPENNQERDWPLEFAKNGDDVADYGIYILPTYVGTCNMSVQPIDEFSKLLRDFVLGGSMLTAMGLLRKLSRAKRVT
jgi:hypothetical protein